MNSWRYPQVKLNSNIPRTKEQEIWIAFLDRLTARVSPRRLDAHVQGDVVLINIYDPLSRQLVAHSLDRSAVWPTEDVIALLEATVQQITKAFGDAGAETKVREISERARIFAEQVEKKLLGK
jgi:hypothetical protein